MRQKAIQILMSTLLLTLGVTCEALAQGQKTDIKSKTRLSTEVTTKTDSATKENEGEILKAKEIIAEDKPLDIAEVMPSFLGGTGELMKWLSRNIKYPAIAEKNGKEGRVIVRFAVGKDGYIRESKVIRSIDPALDQEALRVVKAMPRWTPGRQGGKAVSVYYTLPVTFYLNKSKSSPSTEVTTKTDSATKENGGEILKAKEVIAEEKPLDIADVMPSFPGGDGELMKWLSKNIKYPNIAEEYGIEGNVIIRFAVGKDGSIRDPKVLKSVDPSLDKEALRVVKAMPRWIPGRQDGKAVSVYYTLPVTFQLVISKPAVKSNLQDNNQ